MTFVPSVLSVLSSAVTTTTSTATTAVATTIAAATTTASVSLASDGSINSIIPNRTTEQVFTIIESDNPPHHPVQPKNSEGKKHDANTDLAVHQPVIQPLPSLSQTSSNSSQQKTKTKPKQNKSQNVPAIDKSNFEIECQRKQLVAAQAKIQELEVEMTKLKKTNFILGERIKMFEKNQDKDLHNKYFSPHPNTNTNNTTGAHQHPACTQYYCWPPPPFQCHSRCSVPSPPSSDLTPVVEALSEQVSQLSGDTAKIRITLDKIIRQGSIHPVPQQHTSAIPPEISISPPSHVLRTETPLSPDIIVVEASEGQLTPAQVEGDELKEQEGDQSMLSDTNTIDDFVNEQLNSNNLNYRALTSQSS